MTIRLRGWVRDFVLIAFAVCVGWWMRGADRAALAASSSSAGDGNLAFQMIGTGPASTLAMYNPGNRTLYVYTRAGSGDSSVPCTYSFTVSAPGAALERKNCPVGELR